MSGPTLRAEGLRKAYGGRSVVDVDALEVRRGEVLAVLGPNGAGKSTLFRLLLLLEAPDRGRILLGGRVVRPGDREAARALSGVFQRAYLFGGTVADNIGFGLRVRGVAAAERRRRIEESLEWIGIPGLADRRVERLSGGEAQRVALARALVLDPELVLLDEPTANLDVTVRRRFQEDLARVLTRHARSAVLVTHDPSDAFALADRILVMEGGRVVQEGPPEALVLAPATAFVAAFTGAELLDGAVGGRDGDEVVVELEGGVRLRVSGPATPAPVPIGSPVQLAYRPEDVMLRPRAGPEGAPGLNEMPMRVVGVTRVGGSVRLRLEGGIPLAAVLSRGAAEALPAVAGTEVLVTLPPDALRLLPAAGSAAAPTPPPTTGRG